MSSDNGIVVPQEDAIVIMPCGPHRILRLSDGNLCAVPEQLPMDQRLFISALDAPTLLQFRSENAEVIVGDLWDITDSDIRLGTTDDEAEKDDVTVDVESEMHEDEDGLDSWYSQSSLEQKPGPSDLHLEQVDESEGDTTGRFMGVLDKSKFGRHPVLVYKIPDQESCYTFALHRTFQRSKTYRCIGCMKVGLYTAVKVVEDYEFAEDPCTLNHACLPSKWLKEKSRRAFYEQCQTWKKDGKHASSKPSTEHFKFLLDVNMRQNLPIEEREAILEDHLDYARLRSTITRKMSSFYLALITRSTQLGNSRSAAAAVPAGDGRNIAETYHSCLRNVLMNKQSALRDLLKNIYAVKARSLGSDRLRTASGGRFGEGTMEQFQVPFL